MIRRRLFAAAAVGLCALTLAPLPLAAQDTAASAATEEMEQAMAMFGGMFPAEPLTAEQEARLPQAQRIIGRMIPEGTLSELMGSTFDKMIGPIMQAGESPATATVTRATGLNGFDLDLTPQQTEELASLFDPAWAERQKREMAMFPGVMAVMMDAMEPGMRKAMSELYAINFSEQELDEIEAFFLTPTGTSYARKSFTMSSDPRVLSASMEAMPALMGIIGSLEQKAAEATADLPPARAFADLTPAEQAKVAELTGLSVDDIRANLDAQAETDPAEHAH